MRGRGEGGGGRRVGDSIGRFGFGKFRIGFLCSR